MDYQFACVLQLLVLSGFLHFANAIIARDLLLTPKQGLQINGKSVYYAEEKPDILRNTTSIPWERTLKHVTFVTIFSNAAVEAVAGNLSKLREYNNFLQSPYIRQNDSHYGRFGDIVLLASGRLEEDGLRNGSYRFVEGRCLYECEEEHILALWQVQKIRHRDTHRTYRYEMKYSVSPIRMQNLARGDLVATQLERDLYQTYIQKDDDYPQNFGHITYAEEQKFAERRFDNVLERSFRQVAAPALNEHDRKPTQSLPQSTFISDRFLPPPPPPPPSRPNPDSLNIGEYIKGYTGAKATPKIEVHPKPANRMGYHTATTFRPAYHLKLLKSDNYMQPQNMAVRFPDNDQDAYSSKLATPLVTHHFHHHFFMPPSNSENSLGSAEQQQLRAPTVTYYKQQPAVITSPTATQQQQSYLNNFYEHKEQHMPPAPQKVSIPIPSVEEEQPQLLQQNLVHVTPVPPLRKPQVLQMFPISIGPKIPLYIYPAPVEENTDEGEPQHVNNKPFRQSELMPSIRYSEPDPLYVNVADENSPQLETPPNQQDIAKYQRSSSAAQAESFETQSPAPDSIAAQLPSPAKGQEVSAQYNDDNDYTDSDDTDEQSDSQQADDQEQHHSLKDINIATEKTSSSTVKTEATPRTETTTFEASLRQPCFNTTSSENGESSNERKTTKNSFVSTSTTEKPLHMVARAPKHRTTTEKPVLKWKPRRKANFVNKTNNHLQAASGSSKHEQQTNKGAKNDSNASKSGGKNANDILNEIFEVLTQKSVSKSVSIKIGNNGEEIPVLEDDMENGIRRKISTLK